MNYPRMEKEYSDLLDKNSLDEIVVIIETCDLSPILMGEGYYGRSLDDWDVKVLWDIHQLYRSRKLTKIVRDMKQKRKYCK